MLRLAPIVAVAVLAGPVLAGLAGVLLPAFGYLPALGGEGLSLLAWRQLVAQPGLAQSVAVSLASGLLVPLVALGIVFLFLAGGSGTRLFALIRGAMSPLLAVPHAAAAFGLAFLIAPSGLLARLASPWLTGWLRPPDLLIVQDPAGLAMMLGLVVKEVPFLLLMSLAALPQLRPQARLALAGSLGYRPVAAWFKTVAPGLYPLVRLPVFAAIAYASSVVDVALILGPSNPPTLSVAVLRWFNDPDLSYRFVASAGAVLQIGVTMAALALWWGGELLLAALGRAWLEGGGRGRIDHALAWCGQGAMLLAGSALLFGLVGLAVNSVAGFWRFPHLLPEHFTARHWLAAAPNLAGPLGTALLIAGLATVLSLAVVLAVLENETRGARRPGQAALWLLYLPLIVPQVAFLSGLAIGTGMLSLRPGFWLVVAGHVVFVLPYVFLSLSEPYRRLDPRWVMAARTLGAGPDRAFWTVRLPMLSTPCLTAAAVGMAVSIGQYLATQVLGAGRVATVTTEAVALASGGNRRVIGVWALAQAVLPALGFGVALLAPRLVWRQRRGMRSLG
ncbi:MAG TPA: ABC transporter permease subunit [Acetobacteraceae bacterium]|nr:ABC transporter permease subunit [Acetobacteraceae bacterium]